MTRFGSSHGLKTMNARNKKQHRATYGARPIKRRRQNCSSRESYRPSPIKRKRRTKDQMATIRQGLYDIVAAQQPMTVRQVFYRAVSAGVVEKTEAAYKQLVGRLLVKMRMAGEIPFDWISDNTRWMRKPRTHSSMESAIKWTADTYRRALWDNQPVYVEVWTEKDALAGVLLEETRPWDVPLMVSRGFASVTYLYEAARSIAAEGKPAHLYYFGDHDPSGVVIDPTIERRLREFAPEAEIYFERVAVTPDQISQWDLPTRPTKKTDSRSKSFEGESVEVDAIEPAKLRELVRACIERHVDADALAKTRAAEASERSILTSLSDPKALAKLSKRKAG